MALISFILRIYDNWYVRRECRRYGYEKQIVEEYSRKTYIKNYVSFGGKNISLPPFELHHVKCKWKCRCCGQISIGNVKVEGQRLDP